MNYLNLTIPFLLYFIYGLCIGSFLNVVIYRLPRNIPLALDRSKCPSCGHILSAADLIPLFSFMCLGGKCRYCGEKISPLYPVIEGFTGIAFGLCGSIYGIGLYSALLCAFFSALITAWLIDKDFGYIPDRIHIIILAAAAGSIFIGPVIPVSQRLLGGLGIGSAMFLISLATGGGIGGGDIKLMACSGLLLGWKLTLPAFFLAYVLAAIRWLPPYITKKIPARFEVPMAPFFALSLILTALFGRILL